MYQDQTPIHVLTYTVPLDLLIRTTIKFLPPNDTSDEERAKGVDFAPVYVGAKGEEPEYMEHLLFDEPSELPFPLQKEAGEDEDGWNLTYKDDTFLKLRFHL